MSEYIKKLQRPIAIVGMGKSGEASLELLKSHGILDSDLILCDEVFPGVHFKSPDELVERAHLGTLVISPGVPLASPWVEKARTKGIHITSDITLAASCISTEKILGVTGSLAKSTTVSILGAALAAFTDSYFVGGNLGTPFSVYANAVTKKTRPRADWIVLELSSYQLENAEILSLSHSAITFLSPNHLERYQSLEHYYETKWRITEITQGKVFLNSNGGDLQEFHHNKNLKSFLYTSTSDPALSSLKLHESDILGEHNQDNLALAAHIAIECGWPETAIHGMKKFKGLEHRMENCGIKDGIHFINDSKATSIDSVLIAVNNIASKDHSGKIHLLLGGKDKGLPWEQLQELSKYKNLNFIFFGHSKDVIPLKSGLSGERFDSLRAALKAMPSILQSGDTLLLSPGGTSRDEFTSFEERGAFFKNFIKEL